MHNMLPFIQFPLFEGLDVILGEFSSPRILLHCCVETRDWRLVTDCCLICSCICATISCNDKKETEDLAKFSSFWLQGRVSPLAQWAPLYHITKRNCTYLHALEFCLLLPERPVLVRLRVLRRGHRRGGHRGRWGCSRGPLWGQLLGAVVLVVDVVGHLLLKMWSGRLANVDKLIIITTIMARQVRDLSLLAWPW